MGSGAEPTFAGVPARPGGYVAALDGLRALAALAVIGVHVRDRALPSAGPVGEFLTHFFQFGWIGVDLFFVLSGYLITRGLIGMGSGSEALRNFLARRLLRIVPLYLVVVLGWGGIVLLLQPPGASTCLEVLPWHATFLTNAWISANQTWPGCGSGQFWSLAVEMQFYLAWPLLVLRLRPGTTVWVCIAGIFSAGLVRASMLFGGFSGDPLYVLPFTRMDALLNGALLAVLLEQFDGTRAWRRYGRIWAVLWPVQIPLLVAAALHTEAPLRWNGANPWMATVALTTNAMIFGALVLALLVRPTGAASRLLSWAPLRRVGVVSYCIYLVHPVVHLVLQAALRGSLDGMPVLVRQALVYGVVVAISMGVAELSWRHFERPILGLKRHFPVGTGQASGEEKVAYSQASIE